MAFEIGNQIGKRKVNPTTGGPTGRPEMVRVFGRNGFQTGDLVEYFGEALQNLAKLGHCKPSDGYVGKIKAMYEDLNSNVWCSIKFFDEEAPKNILISTLNLRKN